MRAPARRGRRRSSVSRRAGRSPLALRQGAEAGGRRPPLRRERASWTASTSCSRARSGSRASTARRRSRSSPTGRRVHRRARGPHGEDLDPQGAGRAPEPRPGDRLGDLQARGRRATRRGRRLHLGPGQAHALHAARLPPAREARGPGQALGGPRPRAEQPRRRRQPGLRRAAAAPILEAQLAALEHDERFSPDGPRGARQPCSARRPQRRRPPRPARPQRRGGRARRTGWRTAASRSRGTSRRAGGGWRRRRSPGALARMYSMTGRWPRALGGSRRRSSSSGLADEVADERGPHLRARRGDEGVHLHGPGVARRWSM